MQPSSPPLSPSNISRFSSPCNLPEHLTAAILVLVNKPDTHFYPVFHVQKDPPPDMTGVNTLGQQITAYDQIIMGSDAESDLRMFFAEPKHCSLVVDSLGTIYILNFSSGNPCLLNNATLTTNTLHLLVDRDVIHVAGKDFRVEYKPGYPISATEATHEDTPTQLSDTVEPPEDTIPLQSPSSSPRNDREEIRTPCSVPKTPTSPTSLKSGTVPHDTTDNSYTSMEVNTSQPSMVARDMSTTMDVSLEPSEMRRVSDPPKKAIQSPIKLKRKSAPLSRTKVEQLMETSSDSPGPRRSPRAGIGQTPLQSPAPSNKRSSPKQYPPGFKHPHARNSPLTLGSRKSVRFGPSLSPEEFCKEMPPSTPVKRGGTPIRKSATLAVLRRSTPYKVPIPLSAQLGKRSSKSIPSSPEEFLLNTPKFALSPPMPRTPRSVQTLSPVKEIPIVLNPIKPLATEKPGLRRKFTSGVVSEIAQSQSLKLSSRISTPTSLHSKQPTGLLDKGTPTGIHKGGVKMSKLVSSQSFGQSADSNLKTPQIKRNSKSPEVLLQQTSKRTSVSPSHQTGQKESPKLQRQSPRLSNSPLPTPSNISGELESQIIQRQSPRLSNSPLPTPSNGSGELESQIIQRQSPRLSKSPVQLQSPNPNNLSGQSESPLSRTRSPRLSRSSLSTPGTHQSPSMKPNSPIPKLSPRYSQSSSRVDTPKFLSNSTPKLTSPKTPGSAPQRKSIQNLRTSSIGDSLESPRVSKRISAPPDTFQSPVSSRHQSQYFTPQENKPYVNMSPAEFYKSPATFYKSPAVTQKSPAVNQKFPAVNQKFPAVNQKSPAVNQKSPAVNQKFPAVNQKSPAVNQKSPAVNQKSPAVNQKSPAVSQKSSAVIQKSSAVNTKFPAVNKRSPTVNQKSPAVSQKSPAAKSRGVQTKSRGIQTESQGGKSRKSAPPALSLRSRVSPSPPLSPPTNTSQKRPPGTPKSPHLAWVSPKQSPRSHRSPIQLESHAETSSRTLRSEDAFNPKLFQTPKSKNRTSRSEENFSPSLFDTPEFPRGSKRSISAPHDTPPTPSSDSSRPPQRKRSKSAPVPKEPRKKNTAVPEDAFVPYLFRSPRTKQVHPPQGPEENFSPGMFRTPPDPLQSPWSGRGVKRPLSTRGNKPTRVKRGELRQSPVTSPLIILDTKLPRIESQVGRGREVLKRGVNKKATSSPAKVVLMSSPTKTKKSPVKPLESSSSDSISPVPIRLTRNRKSKQNIVSPAKLSIESPVRKSIRVNKPAKESKVQSPVPVEVIKHSISPNLLRGNRQRSASTKPVSLKKEIPVKVEKRVSSPVDSKRVLRVRNEKIAGPFPASSGTKSILKSPSKRQIFSPTKSKINIPISPKVSKLHNLKRTEINRGKVSFAASPKRPASLPKRPTRIFRSEKGRFTRSSLAK